MPTVCAQAGTNHGLKILKGKRKKENIGVGGDLPVAGVFCVVRPVMVMFVWLGL